MRLSPRACPALLRAWRRSLLWSIGALLLFLPVTAEAQRVREVRIQIDNDNFSLWVPREDRTDWEYTHGTRITAVTLAAPLWGALLAPAPGGCVAGAVPPCARTVWEVGQLIFTPRVNEEEEVPGARPHAGWLYGAATAQRLDPLRRHSVRFEVGVTGEPSLAAPMQRFVHRIGGFWEPLGWENQIPFEIAGALRYEYAHLLAERHAAGTRVLEVVPMAGVSLGTLRTAAEAGADIRLGVRVPHGWWEVDAPSQVPLAAFLTGGLRGEAVLRNLFLDGRAFGGGPSVGRLPLLVRHHVGAVLRVGSVDAEVRVETRTREYRTEPGGHRYTSFGVTYRP